MLIKPLERIHPQQTHWLYNGTIKQHIKRYELVEKTVANKTVLDIACGTGYGSNILSKTAKGVIGIDISQEAIEQAKKEYSNTNIKFQQGDAAHIPFPDNTFDAIVSFETIEHLPKEAVEKYLGELKRVLKPDGEIYISSPDITGFSLGKVSSNHFHIQEFTKENFEKLLAKYFLIEQVYAQELIPQYQINFAKIFALGVLSKPVQQIWRAYKTIIGCTGELTVLNENESRIPMFVTIKGRKTQ
jgi:ubiquinone/menaquinone biosynthesis C-methylase UbiE